MNESTTITIDNIVKLIEGIAKAEYQRGYVAGLEEKRLTEKHWGRKQPEKPILDKMRAEIEHMDFDFGDFYDHTDSIVEKVLQVVDKYKKESEDKE